MLITHIVRRGDHLPKLAFERGVDPETVWNHPKNKALRELRKDWHILCEGDILTIPVPDPPEGLPIRAGTTNRYKGQVPKIDTPVRFADEAGPYAGEAYVIRGMGKPVEGTTDGDGHLTISSPMWVRTVQVEFPARGVAVDLLVGDMDPITEISGVQMRLAHLGYLKARKSNALDEATVEALRAFQRAQYLDPSGQIDDATVAALKDAFGC